MKLSERIREIVKALKIVDNKDPEKGSVTYVEQAIMQFLDEEDSILSDGSVASERRNKKT